MANPCPHPWERLQVCGGWNAAGRVDMLCDCGAYVYFDIADAKHISDPTITPIETPAAFQESWDRKHLSDEHFNAKAIRYERAKRSREHVHG